MALLKLLTANFFIMENQNIISEKQIKKIAGLARISLKPEEEKKFAKEIGSILDYFKDISKLELGNMEKFDHYNLEKNQIREDVVEKNSQEEKEAIKNNFPQRKGEHLSVKAVL